MRKEYRVRKGGSRRVEVKDTGKKSATKKKVTKKTGTEKGKDNVS